MVRKETTLFHKICIQMVLRIHRNIVWPRDSMDDGNRNLHQVFVQNHFLGRYGFENFNDHRSVDGLADVS
jgi:hypothetical protein